MNIKLGIVDPCIHCGESTAMGYGNFVNRIPAESGWACPNCAGFVCDHCEEQIYLDTEHSIEDGRYHYECLPMTEDLREIY